MFESAWRCRPVGRMTEPTMFEFEDQIEEVARLVEGVDNDPGKWPRATGLTLRNAYGYSAFFSLDLPRLNRRCDRISTLVNGLELLGSEKLNRGPLTRAVAGEAVTLRQLVKIHLALKALAKSRNAEAVRAVTIGAKSARRRSFAMAENSVVMSMYWANGHMIRSLRKSRDLSKREMGQLVFGGDPNAVFEWLEEGLLESKKDKKEKEGKKDKKEKAYEYRVTRHTAELSYRGFQLLYKHLPAVELDHEAEEVAILNVFPEFSHFFDARHTAGLQNGKRTLALPVSQGNLLTAPTGDDLKAQETRIKAAGEARPSAA
jgi:hypothetical protein